MQLIHRVWIVALFLTAIVLADWTDFRPQELLVKASVNIAVVALSGKVIWSMTKHPNMTLSVMTASLLLAVWLQGVAVA